MTSSPLFLFLSNVWPEPDSSAAGIHSLQLMHALMRWTGDKASLVWASTARPSPYALPESDAPCRYLSIRMNDETADVQLRELNPAVVIFDRFMAEEQFGWRVRTQCPDALRLLHIQDLHFLRRHRQKQPAAPDAASLCTDTALRELAAIFRCDLSLIISSFEIKWLQQEVGIPADLLHYFPLAYDGLLNQGLPAFGARRDFISIGNFLHPPNKDAVMRLKSTYWLEIRRRLPDAQLQVYGAYCPPHIMQMNRPEEGFLVHGRTAQLRKVLSSARVLLAPLRYGAGLKGKLLEAMRLGTPSVTTPAGCEGITGIENWPGAVLNADASSGTFAEHAAALYEREAVWQKASDAGRQLINRSFNKAHQSERLAQKLTQLFETLTQHRTKNLVGRLLWHHGQASTRYMSLWIQEKEKNA